MAPPPMKNWKVLKRTDLTADVFELKIKRPDSASDSPDQSAFNFKAGQYISIVIPGAGPGGRNLRRAYSIASPPEWDTIELCVKLVDEGPGTNYLNSLKDGDEFQGQAPFGDFVLEHDQTAPCMFIGTGTGLAPLRAMILSHEWASKAPVAFLLGVRAEKDIIYPEFFGPPHSSAPKPMCVRDTEHAKICVSRPEGEWPGFRGRVTDYIREMTWDFARSHYYLCGSGAMIAEVKEILGAKGVDKEQIHTEKYF